MLGGHNTGAIPVKEMDGNASVLLPVLKRTSPIIRCLGSSLVFYSRILKNHRVPLHILR